jgi:Mlc titration factor MtfA (ptsG expression regulator)
MEKEKEAKSDREKRFAALLEAYAASNPAKYAAKKKCGEFDKIPDSFI